jgi:hypothetical protein
MASKKPIGIVVRRGALRRFDALTRKTADLPVEVTWDRRAEERRVSDEAAGVERRSGDRRKKPPFTWQVADFVVVDSQEQGTTSLDEPSKKHTEGDRKTAPT